MRQHQQADGFKLTTARALVLLLLILGCFAGAARADVAGTARVDTVVLQGSTTFNAELMVDHLPAIAADSHHDITVIPNKSDLGLLALFEGKADLAMISTALANATANLHLTNPEYDLDRLRGFEIARTRAALVTHPDNPVRSISRHDLRRVLLGEITDWKQLGGVHSPIRLVAAIQGGGVVSSVEAAILGADRHITAVDQIRVRNGPQIIQVVEQEPGALGITMLKLTRGRQVQELAMSEPIEQRLSLVSLGPPSPAMLEVIASCRKMAAEAGIE